MVAIPSAASWEAVKEQFERKAAAGVASGWAQGDHR